MLLGTWRVENIWERYDSAIDNIYIYIYKTTDIRCKIFYVKVYINIYKHMETYINIYKHITYERCIPYIFIYSLLFCKITF